MSVLTGDNPFADWKNRFIFEDYLEESSEANAANAPKAEAYETLTAMKLHDMTGARNNDDPKFRQQHHETIARHHKAMAKLSPEMRDEVEERAHNSATGYAKSLKDNHKQNLNDIHEVHHTHLGIDSHVGKSVERITNPHDVLVKGKDGFMHGTSLKYRSGGAVTNGSLGSYSKWAEKGGMKNDWPNQHAKLKKDAVGDASIAELRRQHAADPEAKAKSDEMHKDTMKTMAQTVADHFNSQKHEDKHHLMNYLAKTKPDLGYDYTPGEKVVSYPHDQHPQGGKILAAKSLTAHHNGTGRVHIRDHEGNNLLNVELRASNKWSSPTFTTSYMNGKPAKEKASKPKDKPEYSKPTNRNKYK